MRERAGDTAILKVKIVPKSVFPQKYKAFVVNTRAIHWRKDDVCTGLHTYNGKKFYVRHVCCIFRSLDHA